ncbi:MAG TPA: glycosyltransferase family 2 protein [Candidatus Microsaccharimonas sp.]|jgi:GT2 family glycosyltransferase
MKISSPLVSVVVLNWNGLDDTKTCLEYLRKQTYKNYEIIVVDNGSTDESLEYLKTLKDIVLVANNNNHGFAGGHIDGLAHAKGEYILLLNNDAVTKPDLIERCLENFTDPSIGVVGGRAYRWNKENPLLDESNSFYSYQFINTFNAEAIFYQKDYGVSEEVNNVSGSCVMVRRSVIESVGYLENRFFAYYEECDLFARAKRAGYKVIYDPKVQIWHKIGASSERKSSSFMYYMLFRNRFFFAVRNFQKGSLGIFLRQYLKFGVKSIIKSILNRGDQSINKPFAKAFLYNIVFGYRSFHERYLLRKQLGESHYNDQILIEQANVSHVTVANTKESVQKLIDASKKLRPSHELIIVVDKELEKVSQLELPHNVRICVNRGYFNIRPENYGVIISKYDWVSIVTIESFNSNEYHSSIDESIARQIDANTQCEVLTISKSSFVLFNRQLFLDVYGFGTELSKNEGLALVVKYAQLKNVLFNGSTSNTNILSALKLSSSKEVFIGELAKRRIDAAKTWRGHFYDPLFRRFYRLEQLRTLLIWLVSPKIKLRLKVARLRNLVLFTIRLQKKNLGIELKHIRNEALSTTETRLRSLNERKLGKESFEYLSVRPEETPVFIICRDRLSPLLELIEWLEKAHLTKIVLIDNDSAFPELVEYLSKTPYQVLDMKRNVGHTVAWRESIIPILIPSSYYIITDPDVIPASQSTHEILKYLYEVHGTYKNHLKVGLGLKIDDLPDHYSLKKDVIQWESQFWKSSLAENIFESGVDTTFALYKPFTYQYIIHPSIRLGEPYTARHLPWYSNDSKLNDEDMFYRVRADQNVNTWNKGKLPERYIKELAKQARNR